MKKFLTDVDVVGELSVNGAVLSLKAWKDPVRLATTADITLTPSGTTSVDGGTVGDGDRVLVKNQSVTSENGIYVYDATGLEYVRAADFDTTSEIAQGTRVYVQEGAANAGKTFEISTSTPTIGAALAFAEVVSGGAVTLQDAYDDTIAAELFPTFFVKSLDTSTHPLVVQSSLNPAVPFGNVLFLTPTGGGGTNAETLVAANQGETQIVFVASNEASGTSQNIGTFLNSGALTTGISLIQAQDGSLNEGQGFLVIQNLDNNLLLNVSGLVGSFQIGETVTGAPSTATGVVTSIAADGLTLSITPATGTFTAADAITGGASSATANVDTIKRSGNDVPLVRLNGFAGSATSNAADVLLTNRTFDPSRVLYLSSVSGGPFTAGEVVTGGTSLATGTVTVVNTTGTNYLIVKWVSGTFSAAETITGGTSLATATVDAIDSTALAAGSVWYNSSESALKYSEGVGHYKLIGAEEGVAIGPLTVDVHGVGRPLVFEASAQSVPVGSTLFYNDTANTNSIPLGILNNAAAGFGMIAENMTGASLTALAQFQNAGTVNAAGAIFVVQSSAGSTNNGQAFLVVQNQDTAGNNDVPLIRLNHLAGSGTGDAVDIQFTTRTADPTTLTDGGLWFNTSDNQMKFSDGTATYPLAHLEDGTNRGSLNLPVLSANPSAPSDGDVWLFDSGGTRAIRARMGGVTYSVTLT